jgi:hypothetical protein
MANQIIANPSRVLDLNGYTVPGAKMTVYQAGTSTLLGVFSDKDGTVGASNPVIADANGVFPQRYVNQAAKVVIATADDVTLYTLDPAPVVQATGAGASQISFAPTIDVPANNVQTAIETVAANVISGFAQYGIGITGNAELLADLDATSIGAGVYRFNGTTVGTFPSGVVAADTGLVETWRQASNVAMMALYHATSDRAFHRRMSGGVWGAWREIITANQAAVDGDILRRSAGAWTRLPVGADGTVLGVVSGAPAYIPTPSWTFLAEIATPSGSTPADFNVATSAVEIAVFFMNVDRGTAADDIWVRLGTASAFETTGYTQSSVNPGIGDDTGTTRFTVRCSTAGAMKGTMRLYHLGANKWVQDHNVQTTSARVAVGGGFKTLADALTRIRVLPSSGNWAGGSIAVAYR